MKRLLYLIMLPLLCASCSDNDKPAPDIAEISLDPEEITFEQAGSTATLRIETNGKWQAESIPDWITLNHASGSTSAEITVTALENESTEARDAEIKFLRGDKEAILKVHQNEKRELTWSTLCFSPFENVSFVTGKDGVERIYSFETRQLFINPDANTDIKNKIFLGNLINCNLEKNTDVSVYEGYTFIPITISPSISTTPSQTFIPSKANQDAYANKVLSENPKGQDSAQSIEAVYTSHRELNLIGVGNMGVNLDELVSGKSYQEQEMTKKSGLLFSFCQSLFTLSMDLQKDVVSEVLKEEDFPNNCLSYISSVSYGRIGLLIVESDYDVDAVRSVVRKVLSSESLTTAENAILEELDAYHLYFDQSQKLISTKGKADAIEAYKTHVVDDLYNVYPFRFVAEDYFEHSTSLINFSVTLP